MDRRPPVDNEGHLLGELAGVNANLQRVWDAQMETNRLLECLLNAAPKPRRKAEPKKVSDLPPEAQHPLLAIWNAHARRFDIGAEVKVIDPNGVRMKAI